MYLVAAVVGPIPVVAMRRVQIWGVVVAEVVEGDERFAPVVERCGTWMCEACEAGGVAVDRDQRLEGADEVGEGGKVESPVWVDLEVRTAACAMPVRRCE